MPLAGGGGGAGAVPFAPGAVPFPVSGGGAREALINFSLAMKKSAFNSFRVLFAASSSGIIFLARRSTVSESTSTDSGFS